MSCRTSVVTPAVAEATYRAYIAGENKRDRTGMERCLSPSMTVSINGVNQLADRDADAEATDRLLAMYPDYRREVLHLGVYVLGDACVVAAEWTMAGNGRSNGVPDLWVAGCTVATVELVEGVAVITVARLYTDPLALAQVL